MNGSEIQKEQPQHAGLFHMFFRRGHSNIGSQKPYWLVVSAPLKNMSSSVGMIIPPRLWWESHNPFHGSLNHQPVIKQCIFHHIHYISIYNQIITGNFITLNSCIFENCHISWGWVGWGQPEKPIGFKLPIPLIHGYFTISDLQDLKRTEKRNLRNFHHLSRPERETFYTSEP